MNQISYLSEIRWIHRLIGDKNQAVDRSNAIPAFDHIAPAASRPVTQIRSQPETAGQNYLRGRRQNPICQVDNQWSEQSRFPMRLPSGWERFFGARPRNRVRNRLLP